MVYNTTVLIEIVHYIRLNNYSEKEGCNASVRL